MRAAVWVGLLAVLAACDRPHVPDMPLFSEVPPPTREEVWMAIQPQAERYRMEPAFIYALVAAESNFNPYARNGEARGLLQIKPAAWQTVSHLPYQPHVWDWRTNLETGIDYLAYSRSYLHRKGKFSYPLLLAAFHHGLGHVEARRFEERRLSIPDNAIYRQLWAGNLTPVALPIAPETAVAGEGGEAVRGQ